MGWNQREHAIPGWTPDAGMSDRDLVSSLSDIDYRINDAARRNDAAQIVEYVKIRDALTSEAHRRIESRSAKKLTAGGKIAIAVGAIGATVLGFLVGRSSAPRTARDPGTPGPASKD